MRQKAVVLETHGDTAKIKVLRASMCEGCGKRGEDGSCACGAIMGANRVMIAEAYNEIHAAVGEDVEIETDSAVVLRYAALVFLLPVVLFIAAYSVAESLTQSLYIPWIAAAAAFVLAFVFVIVFDRKSKKSCSQIRIVAWVHGNGTALPDNGNNKDCEDYIEDTDEDQS